MRGAEAFQLTYMQFIERNQTIFYRCSVVEVDFTLSKADRKKLYHKAFKLSKRGNIDVIETYCEDLAEITVEYLYERFAEPT